MVCPGDIETVEHNTTEQSRIPASLVLPYALDRNAPYQHIPPARRRLGLCGAVAQLGERRVRNAKVRGSTPLGSTKYLRYLISSILILHLCHSCASEEKFLLCASEVRCYQRLHRHLRPKLKNDPNKFLITRDGHNERKYEGMSEVTPTKKSQKKKQYRVRSLQTLWLSDISERPENAPYKFLQRTTRKRSHRQPLFFICFHTPWAEENGVWRILSGLTPSLL